MIEIAIVCAAVLALSGVCVSLHYEVERLKNRLTEVERKQGQGSKIPDEAVARLADPARLDEELDRAGELSDYRRARRQHKIRENAGPPAKVRKMRIARK